MSCRHISRSWTSINPDFSPSSKSQNWYFASLMRMGQVRVNRSHGAIKINILALAFWNTTIQSLEKLNSHLGIEPRADYLDPRCRFL